MPGVELAGYLTAAVGVGEAARRYVGGLRRAGVPVVARDVPLVGRDSVDADLPFGPSPSADEVEFNLLCLNPEQLVPYLDDPETPSLQGRATIGIWSWEVDVVPVGWRSASIGLAEVWTYSQFAARIIGAELNVPVLGFPPPLIESPECAPTAERLPLELPEGFKVLMMFDYLSTLERKNPLGAIEAYCKAFQPDDGATLVVKSVNGQHRPERYAEVSAAVNGRSDIMMFDQTISGVERDVLINVCDCYLSLHRSEGHGLPLAEAMALGKPVIATAFGGNVEFMNDTNSYLVKWTPTRVGKRVEHYPPAASWAEPDLSHAARLLNDIYRDQEGAQSRAKRAQVDIWRLLAPDIVGMHMRRRLEELRDGKVRGYRSPVQRLAGRLRAARGD